MCHDHLVATSMHNTFTQARGKLGAESERNIARYFPLHLILRGLDTPNVNIACLTRPPPLVDDASDSVPLQRAHVVLDQAPLPEVFLKRGLAAFKVRRVQSVHDAEGNEPGTESLRCCKNLDNFDQSLVLDNVEPLDVGAELFPVVLRHGEWRLV